MAYNSNDENDTSLYDRMQMYRQGRDREDDYYMTDNKKEISGTKKNNDKIRVFHYRGLEEPTKLVSSEMSMNINEAYKNLQNLKKTLNSVSINKSYPRQEEETLVHNTASFRDTKYDRGVNLSSYQQIMSNTAEEKSNNYNINQYLVSPIPCHNKKFISTQMYTRSPFLSTPCKKTIDQDANTVQYNDLNPLKEENENVHITNQILNRSNIELKNQIRNLESELEANKSYNAKLSELNSYIEYLKTELNHAMKANSDMVGLYEKMDQKADDLISENTLLKNQLENLNINFSMSERTNAELKMNIGSIDDLQRNHENEKNALSLRLNDNNRQYEELSEKNRILEQHCENLQKSILDYEEMLGNMKRTIEILSGSETGHDKELIELKSIIHDREEIIKNKNKEIENYKTAIHKLEEEKGVIKNEFNAIKSDLSMKNNIILESHEMSNKTKEDIEALILKNKNLATIISEKDSTIGNLNTSYAVLNKALEDIKQENDELKKIVRDKKVEEFSKTSNAMRVYEGLKKENENLLNEIKSVREWNDKLSKQYEELLNNNDALKKKVPSFETNTQVVTSTTVEKLPEVKCEISEGTKFIFRVYDNKRILRFDLENRVFQVIEFADYEAFDLNYTAEGSIFLNMMDGFFIVTGENHDVLYFYSYQNNAMNKITKFTDNHSHGSLIVDEVTKSLICLSGWHNKKVERYTNSELIRNYLQSSGSQDPVNSGKGQVTMSYLPEMSIERSESAYLIINHRLYAFFGYCCPKAKYLDTVECLDLTETSSKWEAIKYTNETHISTFIKSHSLIKLNDQEILIVGGFDGMKESPIENFIKFGVPSSSSSYSACAISMLDRKLPEILINHCYTFQKDSQFVPFVDGSKRLHFASIDEMDNAHIVEVKSLQYDVFKFD